MVITFIYFLLLFYSLFIFLGFVDTGAVGKVQALSLVSIVRTVFCQERHIHPSAIVG